MKKFISVVCFSLLMIGFFAGYSNFGIPQIQPAPPPVQEVVDLSSMDMEQFLALGERLVAGKGTCTLCHNSLGRAPMLDQLGAVMDERLSASASDSQTYLYDSLVEPSAYVVAGFGKAGSNDTESPMPNVATGGISLSEVELLAVVAHLQDLNGFEVTVEIPTDAGDAAESEEVEEASGEPREPITDVQELVMEHMCGACHFIGEDEGEVGPDLRHIGSTRDAAYIRRALLDPNADIAEGYEADMMPPGLGEVLYASELELLVTYLVEQK